MQLRIRGPSGSASVSVSETDTVASLLQLIQDKTSLTKYEIRYGYPPKLLLLEPGDLSKPLSKLDIKLNGEQLLITAEANERRGSDDDTSDTLNSSGTALVGTGVASPDHKGGIYISMLVLLLIVMMQTDRGSPLQ